ncbi:transcriptional activator [Escherichia coli]|uniref:Transcriptional activator n=1 Tax=Escherichia coli TaxID=562 RepID=A0A484XZX2_ECOLX|nr:transcriptional activator [Escherichia coli]
MQSWYLLYCKRGQLQRAQEHLERQAVNCLAPMITLEKIVRGKRTAVSEAIVPQLLVCGVRSGSDSYHDYQRDSWCQPLRALWRVASDSPIGGDSSVISV